MTMIRKFSIPLFTAFLSLLFLSGCFASSGSSTDTVIPTVTSTSPGDGATGVGTNTKVVAYFDDAMDTDTLTQSSFTLKGEGEAAIDTSKVTYDSDTQSATLAPNSGLAKSKKYIATLTTTVKDDDGIALESEFTWSFTTGTTADDTGPTVKSSSPADRATAVGTNTKVVAFFDGAMKSDTLTQSSFTLKGEGEAAIDSKVTYDADTQSATLAPDSDLANSKTYTATLTTAVKDDNNVSLKSEFTWSFTTGTTEDTIAPTVKSSSPADGSTGVALNIEVSVVFSEAIDQATLTSDSFKLTKDTGGTVAGTLKFSNANTVVMTPDSNLNADTAYTMTLSKALTDLAGNALAPVTIGFKTGTELASGPDKVQLGTAENYVLLAKTGISTTGTTTITGDIGVSPESRTAITGFDSTLSSDGTFATSSLVTGKLYAANMTSPTPSNMTTAVSNMETAYTNAAGRSDPDYSNKGAGEIGGLTLEPGLYKWGTGVTVTNDVTLDGGASDVWIFQISQKLVLQDGAKVVLTGGALPENIFWQVAEGVTLKAGATFNGIILSKTGVDLLSGAVLNGRALAQTAVTLIGNDVNEPE